MSNINTSHSIYGELKDRIIKNVYSPGQIISENSLACEFGVSRTPVREALNTLQNEQWVQAIPKVGIQISPIAVGELKNNFDVRKALEALAITTVINMPVSEEEVAALEELAEKCDKVDNSSTEAIELDVKYHETMWAMCRNPVLFRYLQELNYTEQRWWYYMKKLNPDLKEVGDIGSLLYLTECIKRKDVNNALNIMYTHLEYYIHQIKDTFFPG